MATETFSIKEAIAHGLGMFKKYFGFFMMIILVWALFEIVQWQLQSKAGAGFITKTEIAHLYRQSAQVNLFEQFLQQEGYTNRFGRVQGKLQDLHFASDLNLPQALEKDRDKIFDFLQTYRYRLPFPKEMYYLFRFALWILSMLMAIGMTKISLMVSRDEKPELRELFINGALLIPFLWASICYGLAVIGGIILLIVPGMIMAVMLGLFAYFIVDQNMGPIEALKASRALTKGHRWQLFCFGFMLFLFNIAGLLCLLVGMVVTIPASYIAQAHVYDRLCKLKETA